MRSWQQLMDKEMNYYEITVYEIRTTDGTLLIGQFSKPDLEYLMMLADLYSHYHHGLQSRPHKIMMIKFLRDRFGLGLREAKWLVEDWTPHHEEPEAPAIPRQIDPNEDIPY